MISVAMIGRRCGHHPLAYPALQALFDDSLSLNVAPQAADILLCGHPDDLIEAAPDLVALRATHGHIQVLYLSEEPFWDSVGPIDPFHRHQTLDTVAGALPFTCLTHATSHIFDFDRIPYFLLTNPDYTKRYAAAFAQNACLSKTDWQAHFDTALLRGAFMAENRLSPKLNVVFDEHDVRGLCTWRTELALQYRTGSVLRAGKGWPAGAPDRTNLLDWHADKLHYLNRQAVFVSGLENTHQDLYVSEKIFDAFAVGGVPLYYAGANHAVHRVLPPGGWLNLYDLSVADAAAALDTFAFDAAFFEAYHTTQTALADLFNTPALLDTERARLRTAILTECHAVLDRGQD